MMTRLSPSPSAKRIACGLRDLSLIVFGAAGPGRVLRGPGARRLRLLCLQRLFHKAAVRAKPDHRCLRP
eukprot:514749-Alexandrium_andersonii.AAC.1